MHHAWNRRFYPLSRFYPCSLYLCVSVVQSRHRQRARYDRHYGYSILNCIDINFGALRIAIRRLMNRLIV